MLTISNSITIVILFCKIPIYLKYSKTPLIFQSAALPMFSLNIDEKNIFFTAAVYELPYLFSSFCLSHFSSFRLKNSLHLSCYTAMIFTAFPFLTFVCEHETSKSSYREVFLLITVPVRWVRENTYKDVILKGTLFKKDHTGNWFFHKYFNGNQCLDFSYLSCFLTISGILIFKNCVQ